MRISYILLSVLLLSGCSALAVGGSSGDYQQGSSGRSSSVVSSDNAITANIKAEFAADSLVRGFNVSVRTYKGTVTLTGSVGSLVAREQAVLLARDTNGVVAVNNQISIEDKRK
jgi:osmotically-inducible protein OsmY